MLKRNFILSVLVMIISVTYLSYKNPVVIELETVDETNNFIDLSLINNFVPPSENLSDDSIIIVNLWASWCIPCIEEVGELKKISKDSKYYVIGLLVDDSVQNGEEFISEYSIEYPNILHEEDVESILTKFKWTGIPTSVVLNPNYEIIKTFNGPITYQMISEITK